ncbi:MAG TPA: 30S ribosomal protein S6 [Candidatus Atribacteria bacterium]|nr:30S ribosomal protein S6 [Candidatus Atribacteria bacterium]
MRSYELMLAINPQLEEEELDSLINKFKKLIKHEKGKVTKVDKWGKRKLAYEIKDFQEAYYVVLNFNVDEKNISELERVIKLEEKIIRYLLILLQKTISSSQEV